jgi:hypothetical protein
LFSVYIDDSQAVDDEEDYREGELVNVDASQLMLWDVCAMSFTTLNY